MTAAIVYFLLWTALIFVMLRFGCGAHVMGHGHRHRGTGDPANGEITPPKEATDPVCGMIVQPGLAKASVHGGRVYYFCSQDCRGKFEATPLAYVESGAASQPAREAHHGAH